MIGDADTTCEYYKNGANWSNNGIIYDTAAMQCRGGCAMSVSVTQGESSTSYYMVCSNCGQKFGSDRIVSNTVDKFISAQVIRDQYGPSDRIKAVMYDTDSGEGFARLYGGVATSATTYNSSNIGGLSVTNGRYVVIKYRMPKVDTAFTTQRMFVYADVDGNGATAGGYIGVTYTIHQDNEWHTAVIDLKGYKSTFTDEAVVSTVWLRPVSTSDSANGTVNDYIDLAYVAVCNSTDDFSGVIDQNTYEIHTANGKYTERALSQETCPRHTYVESGSDKAYVYTCSLCSKVADFDVDRYFTAEALNAKDQFQLTKSFDTDKDKNMTFVRYTGQGIAGQANYYRFKINPETGAETFGKGTPFNIAQSKYMTIMYRTNNTSWTAYMYLGTKDGNALYLDENKNPVGGRASARATVQLPLSKISANEWTLLVIDLEKTLGDRWKADTNGDFIMETLQFHSNNVPTDVYFDVGYIAFTDTLEDIEGVAGQKEIFYVDANNSGAYINTDGTCIEHTVAEKTENNTYTTYCSVCNTVFETKDITDVNMFVGAKDVSTKGQLFFTQTVMSEHNTETGTYESFTRHVYTYTDAEGHLYIFGGKAEAVSIADSGRYLVMRMRTYDLARVTFTVKTGDKAAASITRTTGFNNGWETIIVDLSQFTSYECDTETTFTIQMKLFRSGTEIPQTVDISYAAIVDDLSEAAALIGEGDADLYAVWSMAPVTYTNNGVACGESALGHIPDTTLCDQVSTCTACGQKIRDAKPHTFDVKNVTRDTLKERATETAQAVYYYSCACGVLSNETFTHGKTLAEMTDLTKSERYDTTANGITNGEKFLFFTDSHPISAGENGSMVISYEYHIDLMAKHFNASGLSFALSGGDWLYDSNTKANAIASLMDIDRRMQTAFGKNYYMIVGNHDYNYQAKNESGNIVAGPHRLTRDEMVSTWYSDERYGGHAYYSFMGEKTRFYVFDSETDWEHPNTATVTAYDVEQIIWFLEQLSANDDAHIALAPHILYSAGTTLHGGTAKLLEFSEVYNNRGTVSYGGKTYDFSGKTGRVEFLIAGHTHADIVEYYNGIPCVLTVNAATGSYPKFDMVAVDYDARIMYTVRVGNESVSALSAYDRKIYLDQTNE